MHARTEELRTLMARHKMKAPDVAEIIGCETNTVRIWRCEQTKRVMPADKLRILKMELALKAIA